MLGHLIFGDWSWGFESYPDKPRLYLGSVYYDDWHYVLHIGPFWLECDY